MKIPYKRPAAPATGIPISTKPAMYTRNMYAKPLESQNGCCMRMVEKMIVEPINPPTTEKNSTTRSRLFRFMTKILGPVLENLLSFIHLASVACK